MADDAHARLLKAISHPLRHRVLTVIDEEGEVSPKDVARKLGEPIGRVSHHVRVLASLGAIELTRTEPRRGATEHYYRAAVSGTMSFVQLDLDERGEAELAALLGETLKRVEAIKGRTQERLGDNPPSRRSELGFLHFERD